MRRSEGFLGGWYSVNKGTEVGFVRYGWNVFVME